MITPELLEYVRQQLAAGHKKDTLRTLLVSNGWQESDVNSAYAQLEAGPSLRPKLKLPTSTLVLVGILVVLLIGAGAYWYSNRPETVPEADTSSAVSNDTVPEPEASPTTLDAVSLAKGVATIVGETGIQVTYISQGADTSSYNLKIENPQNTICTAEDIVLAPSATYICGSDSYSFQVLPDQSTADVATVSVTIGQAG